MKHFLSLAAAAMMALSVEAQGVRSVVSADAAARMQHPGQPQHVHALKSSDFLNSSVIDFRSAQVVRPASQFRVPQHSQRRQLNLPVRSLDVQNLRYDSSVAQAALRGAKPSRAAQLNESYPASGYYVENSETFTPKTWTMTTGIAYDADKNPVNVLFNVIPDLVMHLSEQIPEAFAMGPCAEYTVEGNNLTILPAYIVTMGSEESPVDVFLVDAGNLLEGGDGRISMVLGDDGSLALATEEHYLAYVGFNRTEASDGVHVDVQDIVATFGSFVEVYYGEQPELDQEYVGMGTNGMTGDNMKWSALRLHQGEKMFFYDIIPNFMADYGFTDGFIYSYTQKDDEITIPVQPLLSMSDDYTLFACDVNSVDGTGNIYLKIDEQGNLTPTNPNMIMAFAGFYTNEFDPDFTPYDKGGTYDGLLDGVMDVAYYKPGEEPNLPPSLAYEPENLVLFAYNSKSGYGYTTNCLSIVSPDAPLRFRNNSKGDATAWRWTAIEQESSAADAPTNQLNGTNRDFTIRAQREKMYSDVALVGVNKDAESPVCHWGYQTNENLMTETEGELLYEHHHSYAGGAQAMFAFSDGTHAIMTSVMSDGMPAPIANFTTYNPELPENQRPDNFGNIYICQDKPATPFFFTGLTIPFFEMELTPEFNMHVTIATVSYDKNGRPEFEEILAEGDATVENVDETYAATVGLTYVEFPELYVTDEDGMTESVDHIFVDQEFAVIIEDFNNGSFAGTLMSQYYADSKNRVRVFFDDEEGRINYYTSWHTNILIGFNDAALGYLATDDNLNNVVVPTDGGNANVHIAPMWVGSDDADKPTTTLYLDDNCEMPDWIEWSIANEDYEGEEATNTFDLVFTAQPLPAGAESRTAKLRFWQPGAYIDVTVNQGAAAAIEAVAVEAAAPTQSYTLFGMPAQAGYRGVVVGHGVKALCK